MPPMNSISRAFPWICSSVSEASLMDGGKKSKFVNFLKQTDSSLRIRTKLTQKNRKIVRNFFSSINVQDDRDFDQQKNDEQKIRKIT